MDTHDKAQRSEIPWSIRLTPDEHAALRDIARREHRSMAQQIRAWIDEHRSRDIPEAA